MAAPSPPERPGHLPFDGRPHRLRMGLRRLGPADWIEVDAHRPGDLQEKRRLLASCPDQVLAIVEDPDGRVRAAGEELLAAVVADLGEHHPQVDRTLDPDLHPVDSAGRLTQEDWCLHLPDADGSWRLVAASVCFPTRWDLTTKIGRTVREIHAPVARYDAQLADPVDAYFARMQPGPGVWRLNWNLLDDPSLHQPRHERRVVDVDPADVGERVWLRVERQTLVKLPVSGAIVFGIRVHLHALGSMVGDPDALQRLRAELAGLPPDAVRDKGLAELGPAIEGWLDRQVGAGVRPS